MREALVSIGDTDFEALGIEELVGVFRSAGIRGFDELVCHGTGSVVQVEVEAHVDEERLDTLEYITEWEHVPSADDRHLYVVAFTAPALSEEIADPMDDLVGTCDPEIGKREATLSLVGSQEAIAGTISGYEDGGVRPDLQKLGGYQGQERPLDQLTDRQRAVIQTAYDMGYYEVPGECRRRRSRPSSTLTPRRSPSTSSEQSATCCRSTFRPSRRISGLGVASPAADQRKHVESEQA